jgi:hypothetical protein
MVGVVSLDMLERLGSFSEARLCEVDGTGCPESCGGVGGCTTGMAGILLWVNGVVCVAYFRSEGDEDVRGMKGSFEPAWFEFRS